VRVGEHVEHTRGLVVLDEADAAHVGGELVNGFDAVGRLHTVVAQAEIELAVVDVFEALIPRRGRFEVDGPDGTRLGAAQRGYQVPADEAAGAGYQNLSLRHVG
jgi:hypothetical protein